MQWFHQKEVKEEKAMACVAPSGRGKLLSATNLPWKVGVLGYLGWTPVLASLLCHCRLSAELGRENKMEGNL